MISADDLRSRLSYCPETGQFYWVWHRQRRFVGTIAGYVNDRGYRHIEISGRTYSAHRLAFLFMLGRLPAHDVDHINRRRDDNRFSNLREVSRAENHRNKGLYRNSSTGMTGVYPRGDKYRARIYVNGRSICLGVFDTPEIAAAVYSKAKTIHHAIPCKPLLR